MHVLVDNLYYLVIYRLFNTLMIDHFRMANMSTDQTAMLPTTNTTAVLFHNITSDLSYDDEEKDSEFCTSYEAIIVTTLFTVIFLLGCVGNFLVILVVFKNREQFKNTTNLFILNLAIADLCFIVFCVPFHALIHTNKSAGWPFGEFTCKFVHLVQFCSMVTSIGTLVAVRRLLTLVAVRRLLTLVAVRRLLTLVAVRRLLTLVAVRRLLTLVVVRRLLTLLLITEV